MPDFYLPGLRSAGLKTNAGHQTIVIVSHLCYEILVISDPGYKLEKNPGTGWIFHRYAGPSARMAGAGPRQRSDRSERSTR